MNNYELYEYILSKKKDGEAKKIFSKQMLMDICINILASMFSYRNLPESMPENFIERYFIMNASAGAWRLDDPQAVRYKDEVIVSIADPAERPDCYGIGIETIANTFSGYVKHFKDDSEIVLGWNNSTHTSDMPLIEMFCDMLVEMFTSLKTNIIYSRLKPVFKAGNDTERNAIIEAFKKIKDDTEPIVTTSTNVLEEITGQSDSIKVLDITDVKNADKLQYIIKAIDDAFRWFLTLYGQAVQGNGKMAQQTVDEVNGSTSSSFIIPNDRLKQRRIFVEKINKMFELDIEVDFSDSWKTESLKYKKEADLNEDGTIEELAEDMDLEQTGEQTDEQTDEEKEREEE